MNGTRNEMLSTLGKVDGTHLYWETTNGEGDTIINFYKFGSDRLIGPFSASKYFTINEEQYDKIIYLINHGTDEEIKEFDEGLVELVKEGATPGMPYIVLDGEGYVLIDNVFNEPEADVKTRDWTQLNDDELKHWCDVIANMNDEFQDAF